MGRVVVWFSCGAASAVAARMAVDKYGDRAEVFYCVTPAQPHVLLSVYNEEES